ncbi:MAG: hypothetical protein JWP37_232 [Mucilaginibacter sp.]|nr:hypothetical protein [Mucilaginibacter sp.]
MASIRSVAQAVEFITGALGVNLTVTSISKVADIPERTLSRLLNKRPG